MPPVVPVHGQVSESKEGAAPFGGSSEALTVSSDPGQTPSTVVYDILPLTTAMPGYGIGLQKLSAKGQVFFSAQTVVGLLQTTQIGRQCCLMSSDVG